MRSLKPLVSALLNSTPGDAGGPGWGVGWWLWDSSLREYYPLPGHVQLWRKSHVLGSTLNPIIPLKLILPGFPPSEVWLRVDRIPSVDDHAGI